MHQLVIKNFDFSNPVIIYPREQTRQCTYCALRSRNHCWRGKGITNYMFWDRGGTVVKVQCYKSEGRWFDPSWCQWNFRLHKILPIALRPWGRLSL